MIFLKSFRMVLFSLGEKPLFCTRAQKFARVLGVQIREFAVFRKLGVVPPECKKVCFFARKYTKYVKKCQKTSNFAHFFVKIVYFSKRSGELCKWKNAPQGVLYALQKPANLYSTKCRIFGPHPPVRSTVVGHPLPDGLFWGPPKPAGLPEHASPKLRSPSPQKYFYF
jgi:hypothetical protein